MCVERLDCSCVKCVIDSYQPREGLLVVQQLGHNVIDDLPSGEDGVGLGIGYRWVALCTRVSGQKSASGSDWFAR